MRLSRQHDILGRAAQLGYFFLLALFPALLGLTGLVSMLPIQPILPRLIGVPSKSLATRIPVFSRGLSPTHLSGNRKWNVFIESARSIGGGFLGDDGHHGDSEYRLQREGIQSPMEVGSHSDFPHNRGDSVCGRIRHPDSRGGISQSMDRRCRGIELALYLLVGDSTMANHVPLHAPCLQPHLLFGPEH